MSDAVGFFLQIAFVGFLIWWFIRTRSRSGKMYIGNTVYDYELGDDLQAEWVLTTGQILKFKGIDIKLDKTLPHIYLDSHHDSRLSGPRFYISPKNKVSLEGDFDKYFQLYAVDNYKQLALSIITPDVMQVMMASSEYFDIEIKGTHLRLISQRNIYKRAKREAAILAAAQPVLEEIAHRLKSWNAKEISKVHDTQLNIVPEQTVKFGHRLIRLAWVICALTGMIFAGGWLVITAPSSQASSDYSVSVSTRVIGSIIWFLIPFGIVVGMEYLEDKQPKLYRAIIRMFRG